MSEASLRASLAFVKTVSCFSSRSAFLTASALSFSATSYRLSIWSAKSSALSWSFSDSNLAASSFSAFLIPFWIYSGSWFLEVASIVVVVLDWAFSAKSSNSLATTSIVKSPDSIALSKSSLPTSSLKSFLAFSLSLNLLLASIAASASFSIFVKASVTACLVSAASFLAASSLAMASVKAVAAWVAFCVASFKASVASVLAAFASILALFAVAASAASVLAFSVAVLATVVFSATFVSNSTTFASAVLASASACLISGFVTSILVEVADSSLAWATATPVVAIPIPTRTEATPTLNLRNEYFLCVVIMLILLIF